jgi:hypothetical protein
MPYGLADYTMRLVSAMPSNALYRGLVASLQEAHSAHHDGCKPGMRTHAGTRQD